MNTKKLLDLLPEAEKQLKVTMDRFVEILHDLYGFYYDSEQGFRLYHKELEGRVQQGVPSVIIAEGKPTDVNAIILHVAPISEMVDRNSEEGVNIILVRELIIVRIASSWNDDIRPKIGKILGLEKDGIKSGIMGDISKMRNDIVHNKGRANQSTRNKIIKFQKGDRIRIDEEILKKVFKEIFKDLNELFREHTGEIAYADNSLNLAAKKLHRSMDHKII